MRWKKWGVHTMIPRGTFRPPCEDEIDEFLQKLGTCLKPDPVPRDYRKCCFCHEEGDGLTDGPARLLNLDLDLWVHLNCALWSTEVYETQAGALINVELALRRGLQMKCVFCHKMGATSGCHRFRCANVYHFTCAIRAQCMFFKDKTMLCPMHKPKGIHEQELNYFAVFRRVYVQRDEVRQIASIVQRGERDHTFRVGSLIFHTLGQLLPQQMQAFHSAKALFPVGYEASRLYWSTRYANRRCRYLCSIEEKEGRPAFLIRIVEQGHDDLVLSGTSPKGELHWPGAPWSWSLSWWASEFQVTVSMVHLLLVSYFIATDVNFSLTDANLGCLVFLYLLSLLYRFLNTCQSHCKSEYIFECRVV